MAQCTACRNELPPDAIFCPQCAQRVPGRASGGTPAVAARPASGSVPVVGTISGVETIAGIGLSRPLPGLSEGEVFHGRYTVERQLGAGAMGVVYAAMDQVTGRKVALKLINPALAERPTARERLVREGLMARDVRHSKVVAVYDVGDADGQIYLVMEYLGGDSLRKWLRRTLQEGRDVSFEAARGIIRGILEGLSAAHAAGVVHRDLKPENVMLAGDPDAGECGLKILDFGIARAVGAASHVTTTSASTGTPLYMAPEQKTAADTVGPAADLYAVTAMLYELLLGVAPEGRRAAPSHERRDLPIGIDQVIEKGLANRPRSRYQTAGEFIEALDAVVLPAPRGPAEPPERVEPEPPKPPPSQPAAPESRWSWLKARSPAWALWDRLSKKQRLIVGTAALLALVGVVAVSVYSTVPMQNAGGAGVGPPPVEPPPPEPPQQPVDIVGRWADEITGTGFAAAFSDVSQQGEVVSGVIYDVYGYRAGTFSGRVQGRYLEYSWVANNGMTGTGRGQLREDGVHLDIETYDNATGARQRHTLHKNHMPPQ